MIKAGNRIFANHQINHGGTLPDHKYELKIGDTIAGSYVIKGKVGKGGMGAVYRAMPFHDPTQDVAIKIIRKRKALGPDDILRFQKEAALMSLLHHPNIICFHELGILGSKTTMTSPWQSNNQQRDIGDGYYIVMEYSEGRDLKRSIQNTGRKDLPYFFEVALQVASALDYTHGKNIIHRDIKPHNIVISKRHRDQKGFLVKVLDFGVARLGDLVTAGTGGEAGPDIAGTPLYMSPEQTPYFSAAIDHRVDLYSFGCVLYEILAGRPPFEEVTHEKLMARHAKTPPESLRQIRPDIPEIINNIILKLLEKHPDDRYQTAFGLYADLQRARIQLFEAKRQEVAFPLRLKDGFKAVSGQLPLVGRHHEITALESSFKAVAAPTGRSHMAVIKGAAGMGKTRLLFEFSNKLIRKRVRFIQVKFSRHETKLPFNALANGFNEYLMKVLKRQPKEAEELKKLIRNQLGEMAHIIADRVPGLKPFIDPELPRTSNIFDYGTMDANEIAKREFQNFAKIFSDFTRCLAIDNQPIVFLLDDMHWADEKSLALVDQFFSHNNSMRFFLVASYRTEQYQGEFRANLITLLSKFKRLKRRYREMQLPPFSVMELQALLDASLGAQDSGSEEFIKHLSHETGGIPMVAVELIRTLVAQEMINYNNLTNSWDIKLTTIKQSTLKIDSVDLTLTRIQGYAADERSILEIAAIIGMSFPFELLTLGDSKKLTTAAATLNQAIDEGLIIPTSGLAEHKHLGKWYVFIHPRVREAILDAIPVRQKVSTHLTLAHLMEARSRSKLTDSLLFAIAHHFNEADNAGSVMTDQEISFGIRHNLEAGEAAFRKSSHTQAKRYFERAFRLYSNMADNTSVSNEILRIKEFLGDIEYYLRNPQAAVKYYSSLLGANLDRSRYAQVVTKLVRVTLYGGRLSQSMETILSSIKSMGYPRVHNNLAFRIRAYCRLLLDALPFGIQNKRLYKLCQAAYAEGIKQSQGSAQSSLYWGILLYRDAVVICRKEHPTLGLLFEESALSQGFEPGLAPAEILRTVVDRAARIAALGAIKQAYSLADIAADIAKSLNLETTSGYIKLHRALTIDYYAGKQNQTNKKIRRAMTQLSKSHDAVDYAYARIVLLHEDFLLGNYNRLERAASFLFGSDLPFRNWLNPRGYIVQALTLLLQNDRNRLVTEADKYLHCLARAKFRSNDMFLQLIRAILSSAKGENRRASQSFANACQLYLYGKSAKARMGIDPRLLPFEDDFVALFLCFFLDFHDHSHVGELLAPEARPRLYQDLLRRMQHSQRQRRPIGKLVAARCSDLLGLKNTEQLYRDAHNAIEQSDYKLLSAIAHLWYGRFHTEQNTSKTRSFATAQTISHDLGLAALVHMIEACAHQHRLILKPTPTDRKAAHLPAKGPQEGLPQLAADHLKFLVEQDMHNHHIDGDWEPNIQVCNSHYECSGIYLFGLDHQANLVLLNDMPKVPTSLDQISAYLEPYINLSSTLFLPQADAPWNQSIPDPKQDVLARQGQTIATAQQATLAHEATIALAADELDDLAATQNKASTAPQETVRIADDATKVVSDTDADATILNATTTNSLMTPVEQTASSALASATATRRRQAVNAIIPLTFNHRPLGLIFITDLTIGASGTSKMRQDLDYFGGQLSLKMSGNPPSTCPQPPAKLWEPQLGSMTIEPCPWLDVFSYGQLRKTRESVFYLGMNLGPDNYVLFYSKLLGESEKREFLSLAIWYQLTAYCGRIATTNRYQINTIEIKEEFLRIVGSFSSFGILDEIHMTFSLFNRHSSKVFSGQFGLSRPYIIGAENQVNPDNLAAFHLENGSIIRFWRIMGEVGPGSFYILPNDSSRLDKVSEIAITEEANLPPAENATATAANLLARVLEKHLLSGNFPRYYVAACFKGSANADSQSAESLQRVD